MIHYLALILWVQNWELAPDPATCTFYVLFKGGHAETPQMKKNIPNLTSQRETYIKVSNVVKA